MAEGPPTYLSYLLRLWRARERPSRDGRMPIWRASLQSPRNRERVSFATLDKLFAFLRAQTGLGADTEDTGRRENIDQEDDLCA